MRKKSVLLGFMASGAIVLGTFAASLPASAAPVTSSVVSSTTPTTHSSAPATSVSPDSYGSVICSGDVCVQRITSIENYKAYVEAWANTYSFTGHFAVYGPNGLIANSKNQWWVAGGAGPIWNLAQGGGYYVIAWQGTSTTGWHSIGRVNFAV